MIRKWTTILTAITVALLMAAPAALSQQSIQRVERDDNVDYGYEYGDRGRIDRYLGVEIWPNHNDGEYYEGDRIVLNFRTNRDAFVAIYSIDARGRVNLLFPAGPGDDNFIEGGATHHLPGAYADYDLVVSGPEGVENIQIIASREPFPIPDWYPVSGIMAEGDDRMAFMDYLNDRYFMSYGGQRFAYDRTAIYVNQWEQTYFRPVYHPVYHPWTLTGNVYIDYPWGASVYINGIYWGTTPLYLPRVYVGWHTFTVYDRWGYCWENDIHISRYHTIVLDHNTVRPRPTVQSKYREVRAAGHRDPVKAGYTDYNRKKEVIRSSNKVSKKTVTVTAPSGKKVKETVPVGPKNHVRGSTKIVKTDRGYETTGIIPSKGKYGSRSKSTYETYRRTVDGKSRGSSGYTGTRSKSSTDYGRSRGYDTRTPSRSKSSSGYYQKKSSGKSKSYKVRPKSKSSSRGKSYTPRQKSSSGSSGKSYRPTTPRSNGSSGSVKSRGSSGGSKSSGRSKSSGGSSKSSGGSSKSSGGKSKGKGK